MEYVLKNKYLTVSFYSLGGALHSIKDIDDVEYLWQGDVNYWSGQAPVLFPICGSLRNDKAHIGTGKVTEMPRHGLVRKCDFSCVEQDTDSILFLIESNKEMYQKFPYHFRLNIRYTLVDKQIVIEYIVENPDNIEMPFFIGGHPGFNCPLYKQESYEDYKLVFEYEEDCTVPTPITETGLIDMEHRTKFLEKQRELSLNHELFAKDAIILDDLQSRSVKMCTDKHEKGIKLDFSDFPYLILWSSSNNGQFLAIEPWTGLSTCNDESDIFEEKRNIQKVAPKSMKKYSYTISVL